jgi:hypothetical protein
MPIDHKLTTTIRCNGCTLTEVLEGPVISEGNAHLGTWTAVNFSSLDLAAGKVSTSLWANLQGVYCEPCKDRLVTFLASMGTPPELLIHAEEAPGRVICGEQRQRGMRSSTIAEAVTCPDCIAEVETTLEAALLVHIQQGERAFTWCGLPTIVHGLRLEDLAKDWRGSCPECLERQCAAYPHGDLSKLTP